jgi:serine/threonine protein kinase
VKLADFGASKKLADIASFSEGCKTVTGSPYWMAVRHFIIFEYASHNAL